MAGFGGPTHSRGLRVRASPLTRLPELTGRAASAPRGPGGLLQVTKPIFLRTRASKVAHESPKCCSQQLFFVVRKKRKETIPSLASNRHRKAPQTGRLQPVSFVRGPSASPRLPGTFPPAPASSPHPPRPQGAAGSGRGRCARPRAEGPQSGS